MVIMALDHVRELIHVDSLTRDPTDLATTTPAVFFTRWITHLCAPIFVFLAGTSAYLSAARSGDTPAHRRFLVSPLYDLRSDRSEQHDVSAQHPELVRRAAQYFATRKRATQPAWNPDTPKNP